MRVQLKNGKFAPKDSSIYRFVNRTGKSVDEYYAWAKECGQRASHNYKDKQLCQKLGLADISEIKGYAPLDDSNFNFSDLDNFLLAELENPAELASSFLMAISNADIDDSIDGHIDAHLIPTTKESFQRWSDKNLLNQVSGTWFLKKGTPLDVQAQEMSENFGREITEQDIVDYLTTYKKGKYKSYNQLRMERYEERMEQLIGFKVSEKYAQHLDGIIRGEIEVMADETAPF
jgi:hypothetical protein